jgi:RecA-family ATPase
MLLDPGARLRCNGLSIEHFGAEQHRIIYAAICDAAEDGAAADMVSIYERLARSGNADAAGGLAYLNALAQNTPSAANAAHYAASVERYAAERRTLDLIGQAAAAAESGDLASATRLARKAADEAPWDADGAGSPDLLDMRAMSEIDPTPPQFIIDGWLPAGQATLFAGHGGSGKSLIALTAALCLAAGRKFFGQAVSGRRRVMVLSYEDDAHVMHWRLRRIADMLGLELATLDGWLFVYDASAAGHPLYVELRDALSPAPALDWLRDRIRQHKVDALVIDGTSDAFAGNENIRSHVRAFVQGVRRMLPQDDGALLLLHHVDAATAHNASSKGYSGSTAWHNSCRARWRLRPADDGEDADPSQVALDLLKSNHGKPGASIALRFNDAAGCFVSDVDEDEQPDRPSRLDRAYREADDRAATLDVIRRAEAAGMPLPTASRGDRTAHGAAEAIGLPTSLTGKRGRSRFYAAIESLRARGAIKTSAFRRPNRHLAEVYCVAQRENQAENAAPETRAGYGTGASYGTDAPDTEQKC